MERIRNSVVWGSVFVCLHVLHSLLHSMSLKPLYISFWLALGVVYGIAIYAANTSPLCVFQLLFRGIGFVIVALMLWTFYPSQSGFHLLIVLTIAFLIGVSFQYFRSCRKSE